MTALEFLGWLSITAVAVLVIALAIRPALNWCGDVAYFRRLGYSWRGAGRLANRARRARA